MPYLDLILEVFTQINFEKSQQFCIVDSTSLPVTGYNKSDAKWACDSAGKGKNMYGILLRDRGYIASNAHKKCFNKMESH